MTLDIEALKVWAAKATVTIPVNPLPEDLRLRVDDALTMEGLEAWIIRWHGTPLTPQQYAACLEILQVAVSAVLRGMGRSSDAYTQANAVLDMRRHLAARFPAEVSTPSANVDAADSGEAADAHQRQIARRVSQQAERIRRARVLGSAVGFI